ncbi:MAG: hypothetical protein EKK62_11215 [Acidimicrobiia bacterium]|nr:MAG: hypothetical protein EKK62_11215 [Acidimicrobiia bacterium]
MRRPAIICGGRDFIGSHEAEAWLVLMLLRHAADVVIHGDQEGADRWGARVAEMRLQLPAKKFPPEYERFGREEAPKVRNYQMAAEAAAHGRVPVCLAMPGGSGTGHMCGQAGRFGIPVLKWRPGVKA